MQNHRVKFAVDLNDDLSSFSLPRVPCIGEEIYIDISGEKLQHFKVVMVTTLISIAGEYSPFIPEYLVQLERIQSAHLSNKS